MNRINNHLRHKEYEDEGSAKAVARKLKARGRNYARIRAYPCKVGGTKHWHVGNAFYRNR